MITRRVDWDRPEALIVELRDFLGHEARVVDVRDIAAEVAERGDAALLDLTAKLDAPEAKTLSLRVGMGIAFEALENLDPDVRGALDLAARNVRLVAEAQLTEGQETVTLPEGHTVTVGEVPVGAAGIYAPGGRASYPSTVVMGCVTARVAGVERVVLATPPGFDGMIDPTTLAAAALCEVDEIHAIGGAQAIFALARGTETINPVDVIAGPGNAWVQAAKREVFGEVAIDSLAGPSDLTVVLDDRTNLRWAALDLCAQAEHGEESPLVAISTAPDVLGTLEAEVNAVESENPSVKNCRLALVEAPSAREAIELVNLLAPEHLELMGSDSAALAGDVRTAGCVFAGQLTGTAFGDYVAGSNHVLPTDGTGRIFGPLSPSTFRRGTARVSLDAESARHLAGPLDALARAEGLPVHGLSATARANDPDQEEP
ncbi:MAG: histidinol dehydrogenase [Solirubrobacterales bacterium]|nr:histidinol dehydrogenase [Solirubrobacterales bacterium]HMT05962.1 histidinol dehydrogenase [Solirubrobacterales bacterium]